MVHDADTLFQAQVFTDGLNKIEHQHRAQRDCDVFVELHDNMNRNIVLLPADQHIRTQHKWNAVGSFANPAFFHDPGKHAPTGNAFRQRAEEALIHQSR